MNKKLTSLLLLVLSLCGILQVQAIKVHTIGDSTMQTYDESSTITRGWAQYFQQFFRMSPSTTVVRQVPAARVSIRNPHTGRV